MKAAKILAQKLRTFAHLILICRGNALAIVAREGSHFDRNSGLSLAWRCPINAANSMPQQGEDEGMGREVIHFFFARKDREKMQ